MALIKVGEKYNTSNSGTVEVLEYVHSKNVLIRFVNTGHTKRVHSSVLRKGTIKDVTQRSYCGVGYFGDGPYKCSKDKGNPVNGAYNTWYNMLRRCYSSSSNVNSDRYRQRGVVVDAEWHNFQNFAEWYIKNHKDGFEIDKDILGRGKKIYSKSTCVFVPPRINMLLSMSNRTRGDYANGVHKPKNHRKFTSRMFADGKRVTIGYYDSMHDAFVAYKDAKEFHIRSVAAEEYEKGNIDDEVYNKLITWEIYPYSS